MSRTAAKKATQGRNIEKEMREKGIFVRAAGRNTVREEVSEAYKDVVEVVRATEEAEIAGIVVRLRPVGVVKG